MIRPEKKLLESRAESGMGLVRWLRSLGPGVITAALVLGPGSLTVSTKLGALFGDQLLWIVVVTTVFMMIFTEMGARLGMASDHSLLTLVRRKWGATMAVLIGVGAFLVTASFQAGNAVGTGIAFGTLTGASPALWTILFTLLAMGSLFLKNFYRFLETVDVGAGRPHAALLPFHPAHRETGSGVGRRRSDSPPSGRLRPIDHRPRRHEFFDRRGLLSILFRSGEGLGETPREGGEPGELFGDPVFGPDLRHDDGRRLGGFASPGNPGELGRRDGQDLEPLYGVPPPSFLCSASGEPPSLP